MYALCCDVRRCKRNKWECVWNQKEMTCYSIAAYWHHERWQELRRDAWRLLVLLRSPAAGWRGRSRACVPCWPSGSRSRPPPSSPLSEDTRSKHTSVLIFAAGTIGQYCRIFFFSVSLRTLHYSLTTAKLLTTHSSENYKVVGYIVSQVQTPHWKYVQLWAPRGGDTHRRHCSRRQWIVFHIFTGGERIYGLGHILQTVMVELEQLRGLTAALEVWRLNVNRCKLQQLSHDAFSCVCSFLYMVCLCVTI